MISHHQPSCSFNTDMESEVTVNSFTKKFEDMLKGMGFLQQEAEPVLPRKDTSVYLTGAAITALKEFLVTGVPDPGVFVTQPCLRTRNLSIMNQSHESICWLSHFHQTGALLSPALVTNNPTAPIDILTSTTHASASDFWVELARDDIHLFRPVLDSLEGTEIRISENSDQFSWKYGMDGLESRCLNIGHKSHGPFSGTIGDFIMIHRDGQLLGAELCFGVEPVVCSLRGLKTPFDGSLAATLVEGSSEEERKMLDCLAAITWMGRGGVPYGHYNEQRILKLYLRSTSNLGHLLGWSLEKVLNKCSQYELFAYGDTPFSSNRLPALLARLERARNLNS